MQKEIAFAGLLLAVPALAWTAPARKPAPKPIPWVSLMDTAQWHLARCSRGQRAWAMADSALQGTDSWLGHEQQVGNFVLEGEFLYDGTGQGGIVLRGDRDSWLPWLSGYELDIDDAGMGQGHIHFPCHPQPYGGDARFSVGVWQRISVRAVGQTVTVSLNGVKALSFTDDHFRYGQICLEGYKDGVRYRGLRMQILDKKPVSGARSVWVPLFDGATMEGWTVSGNVSVAEGVMDIDGRKGRAQVSLTSRAIGEGTVELDVWCRRDEGVGGSYRVRLRADSSRAGGCFTSRTDCVLSCGPGCSSRTPMFPETKWPEYWRIELHGKRIDAIRFGDTLMTCRDSVGTPGALTIAADSCLLSIRGARLREVVKKATVAGAKKPVK